MIALLIACVFSDETKYKVMRVVYDFSNKYNSFLKNYS